MADKLPKKGTHSNPFTFFLSYLELYSLKEFQNFSDHWYVGKRPSLTIASKCDKGSQTTLSRLASGHIKCISFLENENISISAKCQDHQASSELRVNCMALTSKDTYRDAFLVLDFLRVNGLMQLYLSPRIGKRLPRLTKGGTLIGYILDSFDVIILI
ncbi:uncharacterized protein TNCV_4132551 [Trichonephila clavipes]|nr:uncharacterized protein TNCV_4132551 [Trichonephila clavipes]